MSSKNIAIPIYPPLFTLFLQVYLLQGAAKKGGPTKPNQCPSDFPWAYNEVGGDLNVNCRLGTFQLLEYQTDMRRCRFDTLGKLTSAHRARAPTACEQWVCSRTVGESDCPLATVAGQLGPLVRNVFWIKGGQLSLSVEGTCCRNAKKTFQKC